MLTRSESTAYRVSNLVGDAIARGGEVEVYSRTMHGSRLVVATVSHPSMRRARHGVGRTVEQACERAARFVARMPGKVAA